jgi:peptide/nickel transport system substrate-binding protein
VATTAIDDKKIKFILKEPFSPFPVIVSRPVFKKGLVGTGDYKLKRVKKNGQIVEKIVLTPVANKNMSKFIFRFYPTEAAARTAFKLGEVDVIKEISDSAELKEWKKVKVEQKIKYNRVVAVFFDTQNPKLADKTTRQALAYAIEKRWQPRALNPINPQSWAFNPTVKKYEFDLAHAQKLLAENEEQDEPLKEIELATIPSLFPMAEEIKKDWQKLGIETKIKSITTLNEGFEALLISQEIPSDPDQYVLWHSTQKSNITGYKSPKIDKLLEEGRKTQDQEKRKEIYRDFQRFLVEDTPAVFLFHPTLYTICRI